METVSFVGPWMEDGVQWHQGNVTWVLEVCTEAQRYSGCFCTRPTEQNVQDSHIICPKWIPCFLWKQLPGFLLTWLFWGFFLGLLREPGCEQGCVQHGAPTAGNTGNMGSLGAHDQGWLHQQRADITSSVNGAHSAGDSSVGWLHQDPFAAPFPPLPTQVAFFVLVKLAFPR